LHQRGLKLDDVFRLAAWRRRRLLCGFRLSKDDDGKQQQTSYE